MENKKFSCRLCNKELGLNRYKIKKSNAWICGKCLKKAGGIWKVDLSKVTLDELHVLINFNSQNPSLENEEKNKTLKIVLLILFFPLSWIYFAYNIVKNYHNTRNISLKHVLLSMLSIFFFFAIITNSTSDDSKNAKPSNAILESTNETTENVIPYEELAEPIITDTTTEQEIQTTPLEIQTTAEIQLTTELQTAAEIQTEPPVPEQSELQPIVEAPVQTEAPPPSAIAPPQERMVWIDDTGKKYHSKSSCSNMSNPYQVSLSDAISRGRDACKKCYK